ncbi:MAG TPA: GNAT family N-acetyltransferase [Acidimicrobiales bacterium]|nr:GNAT family N-acetyltransferase [Acidimicrobiales bacterium]
MDRHGVRTGLQITREDYHGPLGQRLVHELADELEERYADIGDDDAAIEASHDYHAEIAPGDLAPPAGTYLVAWVDGAAVGCAGLRRHGPTTGEIKRMWTAPAARGTGVARALLAALEDEARRLGYRAVRLETGTGQPEAIRLYASAGYEPIDPYGYYAGSSSSRCFEKPLGPA